MTAHSRRHSGKGFNHSLVHFLGTGGRNYGRTPFTAQRILLDLELWGAEIDRQAVLNPRGTQVAQDLGHMLLLISSIVDSFFCAFCASSRQRGFPHLSRQMAHVPSMLAEGSMQA